MTSPQCWPLSRPASGISCLQFNATTVPVISCLPKHTEPTERGIKPRNCTVPCHTFLTTFCHRNYSFSIMCYSPSFDKFWKTNLAANQVWLVYVGFINNELVDSRDRFCNRLGSSPRMQEVMKCETGWPEQLNGGDSWWIAAENLKEWWGETAVIWGGGRGLASICNVQKLIWGIIQMTRRKPENSVAEFRYMCIVRIKSNA